MTNQRRVALCALASSSCWRSWRTPSTTT